jgi:hypothetical protein
MATSNDTQISPQSTTTVQGGLIEHLTQPGPEHKLLEVFKELGRKAL